jgi:lipid-binding SYLF domain-containing protein
MAQRRSPFVPSLMVLILAAAPLQAGDRERKTVEAATEAVQALAALPLKGLPPALLQDAKGVAVIPHVVKAGFLIGGRFGRGVVLVRQSDGTWSNPVFVTLAGGGLGWKAGIQATDLVLVFKTSNSMDRIVEGKGKVTLGGDVGVAAGPVGRQAGAATDGQLKAEIYSYSRSRGLFAGVSLEGAGLLADVEANEAFYGLRGGRPADVLALRGVPIPAAAEDLKGQLTKMAMPPTPPVIVWPAPMSAPPPSPVRPPSPPLPPGR